MSNFNYYIPGWLEKLQISLDAFKKLVNPTNQDKTQFVVQQYELMAIINRALTKQVVFVGARSVDAVMRETTN